MAKTAMLKRFMLAILDEWDVGEVLGALAAFCVEKANEQDRIWHDTLNPYYQQRRESLYNLSNKLDTLSHVSQTIGGI